MKRAFRTVAITLAGLVAVASVTLAISYVSYTAELEHDGPNAVSEAGYVRIGGIDQWIQIRGEDRSKPVMLWLNGGPGFSTMGQTLRVRPWERDFIVVMWDQRGEGKSFARSGESIAETMTVDHMVQDGIEVAEYLTSHLGKKQIVLLGHSWGSMLGTRMVRARPELFMAYVGTGQVVNMRRGFDMGYPMVRSRAAAIGNDKAVAELDAVGAPPYGPDEQEKYFVPLRWANVLDPAGARGPMTAALPWSIARQALDGSFWAGAEFSQRLLMAAILNEDITALEPAFQTPVIFIQGADDMVTPTALAHEYFDSIQAPNKRFTVLEMEGHLAVIMNPAGFISELKRQLAAVGLL